MRVLLIADEPALADLLRRKLEAEGYAVTCASDGIEGERRALADDVNLVVLDQLVPGRNGLDVLMFVRQRKPALPIIVVSARAEVADRIEALNAGAIDFLAKPFWPDELTARVRAHLRRAARA